MYMLYCPNCESLTQLTLILNYCPCKNCAGHTVRDGLNFNIRYWGDNAEIIDFDLHEFKDALRRLRNGESWGSSELVLPCNPPLRWLWKLDDPIEVAGPGDPTDKHVENCCRIHGCIYHDANCSVAFDSAIGWTRFKQKGPCKLCIAEYEGEFGLETAEIMRKCWANFDMRKAR